MSRKATNIVAYLTLVGWLLAYFIGDRENCHFHLNQSLVLLCAGLAITFARMTVPLLSLPLVLLGWVQTGFLIVGLIYAVKDEEKKLPVVGEIQVLK